MKVTFKKDVELSYDGVNSKVYKKGEEYEANHAHEKRVFESMISANIAEHTPVVADKEVKTKVTKPKSRKTAK